MLVSAPFHFSSFFFPPSTTWLRNGSRWRLLQTSEGEFPCCSLLLASRSVCLRCLERKPQLPELDLILGVCSQWGQGTVPQGILTVLWFQINDSLSSNIKGNFLSFQVLKHPDKKFQIGQALKATVVGPAESSKAFLCLSLIGVVMKWDLVKEGRGWKGLGEGLSHRPG